MLPPLRQVPLQFLIQTKGGGKSERNYGVKASSTRAASALAGPQQSDSSDCHLQAQENVDTDRGSTSLPQDNTQSYYYVAVQKRGGLGKFHGHLWLGM